MIRPGWFLGTLEKERFEPAHVLAMGSHPQDAQMTFPLSSESEEVFAYLRGAPLSSSIGIRAALSDGWCLVLVDDFPLGWGKIVKDVLKNFYPRGLRI